MNSEARLPSSLHQASGSVSRSLHGKSNRRSRNVNFGVDQFSKDPWLVARSIKCGGAQYRWIAGELGNEVITSDVQALVVKSDQEVKIE